MVEALQVLKDNYRSTRDVKCLEEIEEKLNLLDLLHKHLTKLDRTYIDKLQTKTSSTSLLITRARITELPEEEAAKIDKWLNS